MLNANLLKKLCHGLHILTSLAQSSRSIRANLLHPLVIHPPYLRSIIISLVFFYLSKPLFPFNFKVTLYEAKLTYNTKL